MNNHETYMPKPQQSYSTVTVVESLLHFDKSLLPWAVLETGLNQS